MKPEDHPCLALSPQGHLAWHALGGEPWPVPAAAERVRDAFAHSVARGLLHLATREADTQLPPGPAFWRGFARQYLTRFCHRPETDDFKTPTALLSDAEVEEALEACAPGAGSV